MQREFRYAIPFLVSAAAVFGQAAQVSTLVNDVSDMPRQMVAGTFSQEGFEASLDNAVGDPNLNFSKLNPLIAADLRSSDVRVRKYAALVVSQLSTRRMNSSEELAPILPAIVSAIDDSERGVQLASIVAAAGLRPSVPDSIVVQLQNKLSQSNVNREGYAVLSGLLTKIRPNDPTTDAVVMKFLNNPSLSEAVRAQAIQEVGSPILSDSITGEIVQILGSSASEQIKMAAIVASESIGPRALSLEKVDLTAIQADKTQSTAFRGEASNAIRMLEKQ